MTSSLESCSKNWLYWWSHKEINEREETNLPYRGTPKNFCSSSALEEVEHNSLFLHCGQHCVTCFQRVQCDRGREGRCHPTEDLQSCSLAGWPKLVPSVIWHGDSMYPGYYVWRMPLYCCILSNLSRRKISDKPKLWGILQNTRLMLFKGIKIIKDGASPRNYHSPGDLRRHSGDYHGFWRRS